MKIAGFRTSGSERGSALLLVLVLGSASLLIVLGILSWSHSNTNFAARNNQYYRTLAAAEAATEKIAARVGNDYQNFGVALVTANLDSYRTTVPTSDENSYWSTFQFTDEDGVANHISVDWLPVNDSTVLSSRYKGLRGSAYDMRILCKAREVNSPYYIVARNRQNLELSVVTVFQYAVFYNVDLEINPSPAMTITGPVHCNANIYLHPSTSLLFQDEVTASGQVFLTRKPGDPSASGALGTITYADQPPTTGFLSLNLPVGTTNTPAAVHQIIEIPPWTESPTSVVGLQRYYNQADMVILVTDSAITATSGSVNGFATTVPTSQAKFFINTNVTFFNAREGKNIRCTDIDVNKLRQWSDTNDVLRPVLVQKDIRTIYVADNRSQSGTEPGIRLINGAWLPPKGLTVATLHPLYIKGNYNVSTNGTVVNLGTNDTSGTVPASIVADAITILSGNWSDANSSFSLGSRVAASTTVNCAILAGNVPTTSANYSGGLENFPRFLEDWAPTGQTFTYNGSMVVMFDSRFATAPWTGTAYSPPIRNWSFDANFNDLSRIPPASPQVRTMLRGAWAD
jgi:hypothetical protein